MRIIVDSNRIIAGLIRNSATRKILLYPEFNFYTPDHLLVEVDKYKPMIMRKGKLSESAFEILFGMIKERIDVIPEEEIQTHLKKAREIMAHIDPDDVPFIALALCIKPDGIWTEDRDFFEQNEIQIYKTGDMLKFMDYHMKID